MSSRKPVTRKTGSPQAESSTPKPSRADRQSPENRVEESRVPDTPLVYAQFGKPAASSTKSTDNPIPIDSDEELPDAPARTLPNKRSKGDMSKPVLFYGKPNQVDDVVTFCKVKFLADGVDDESQKAGYLASLFRGAALSWLTEYMKTHSLDDFDGLHSAMTTTFGLDENAKQAQTARQLANLRQRGSVQQYALTFQQLATKTSMPDQVAKAQFIKGLKPHIQRGLVISDDQDTLGEAIAEAQRIDAQLYSIGRQHYKGAGPGSSKKGKRDNKGRYVSVKREQD